MARSECPNATRTTTNETCVKTVPSNQPHDCFGMWRFDAIGSGGICASPRSNRVRGAQISRTTTMTVVICIMRSALVLDSGTPLMLLHQKYMVTATLKKTEKVLG